MKSTLPFDSDYAFGSDRPIHPLDRAGAMASSAPSSPRIQFDVSGPREHICTASEVYNLLSPFIHDHSYNALRLSNKSFAPDAALAVANILAERKKQLKELDLSDSIAGMSSDQAVQVLETMTGTLDQHHLERFDISDNALGPRGIQAIGEALKTHRKNLKHVHFNNNGLQGDAVKGIAKHLLGSEDNDEGTVLQLQTFEIFNNLLTDAGAKALAPIFRASPYMQTVRIQTNRISSQGGLAIVESLRTHQQLTHITLSDNSFGEEAGKMALLVVRNNINLKKIDFSDIGFERPIVVQLLHLLSRENVAPKLEMLGLNHAELTGKDARLFQPMLRVKPMLRHLMLEGNELGNKGVALLADAVLGHGSLESLNLSENKLSGAAIDSLLKLLQVASLRTLAIRGNYLSTDDVEKLKEKGSEHIVIDADDQEDPDDFEEDGENSSDEAEDDEDLNELIEQLGKTKV